VFWAIGLCESGKFFVAGGYVAVANSETVPQFI